MATSHKGQIILRNIYSKDNTGPSHLYSKLNAEKENLQEERFRLKMVIFKGDHHYIMGRNNYNINRITAATQTYVLFPDPNLLKKGHQVTIIGALGELDRARNLIRLSSPMTMSFELPSNPQIPSPEKIGKNFKLHVTYSSSSKPNTLLASIRAANKKIKRIRKAARALLKHAPEKMENCTIVSVQLEVPPQFQESVKGENCENIIKIMNQTNTKIFFPDLSTRGCRRSQVTITGSIDEVLLARVELVGHFPVELTFDIPAENGNATEIMELGRKAGVCITISHKERGSGLYVTIKGTEKSMDNIFEVHRNIRQINTADKLNVTNVDSAMDNYVENLVEQSETTSNECLSDQSSAMNSPVFGGETQDQNQQNNWMVYEPTYNQNAFVPESFGPVDHQYYSPNDQASYNTVQPNVQQNINSVEGWIPSHIPAAPTFNAHSQQQHMHFMNYPQEQHQLFYPSEPQHQQNNWTICELQATSEETYNPNVQQTETHNAYFQQHSQSVEDVQNQQLTFDICDSEPYFGNGSHSPMFVNSSPLIIGSGESVAGKLICSGWGK